MRRPTAPRTPATLLALALGFALASPGVAHAQRGGRGGGARPGGVGAGPAFRAPVTPQARPGGNFNPGMRPPAGNFNRPSPGVVNRPPIANRPPIVNRPNNNLNNINAGRVNVMDRPTAITGNRQVNVNRPSIVNRPTNVNQNNFNRQNVNNTSVNNVNRQQVNSNNVNSNNRVTNVTNVTNVVNNNRTNVVGNNNNVGRPGFNNYPGYMNRPGFGYPGYGNRPGVGYPGRPGYGGAFPGYGYGRPAYPSYLGGYGGYHSGWYNGYWGGNYSYRPGWNWGSFAAGAAVGGLVGWGFGSSVYNWGYTNYSNPYYAAAPAIVAVGTPGAVAAPGLASYVAPYNYAQPLNVDAAPPAASVTDPAMSQFDSARTFFKAGDYAGALRLTDQAITQVPNDPALHEFRALCLFALGRYDEASASAYAVLSVSPGWNWTTLAGLYPSVDTYTTQLRALEAYRNAHPDSAPARFLLAYQYLTAGSDDAAATELRNVVKLKPSDKLSASLLKQLGTAAAAPTGGAALAAATSGTDTSPLSAPNAGAAPGDTPPADPTPAGPEFPGGRDALNGDWTAQPQGGPTISLSLKADNKFTWGVDGGGGQKQSFDGTTTYENGVLTLARDDGSGALAGRITAKDPGFNFRLVGSPSEDPGLDFHK